MSEQPFAEATVRVTPSLTKFVSTLEEDLKKKMAKVKVPPIRVAPALQIGFLGNLRTQVNDAITKVQGQIKPIRVRVLIETPSRRALRDIVSGAPVSLPGAISGGQVVRQAENERLLNSLRAQGAHDFGLLAEAEEKATRVRERSVNTSKKAATQEQKTAESVKLMAEVRKRTSLIDINAATKMGELRQAQAALTEATKLAGLADRARELDVTKETVALQAAARAEERLRFERVKAIEARPAAAAAPRTTTAARATIERTRRTAESTKGVVSGLREAEDAAARLGKGTKDLGAAQDLLRKRSLLLTAANKAVKDSLLDENQVVRAAAANAQTLAQRQVQASKDQVSALKTQAKEATRAARSSEQLSRGGQASLLSLAGIRGATLAASRSFLVGAAAITVFANAVRSFADLERNLHVFEATTSATEQQMEAVREEARLLGADLTLPAVTAEEAAGAMVELAKAGLTVEDAMAAARSVLELATAAAIDNAEATRLVANVLNAFSLAGTEATAVADTLANAANAAQGSIADIGTAFQQAASAGRQVGLSFQDTATFLTILAKNGIRGSDAGTSLRTALIRLINPSQKAKERFQELGIAVHDAAGNLRPDVFLQIAAATENLSPAARDATIALIGGQDAFRAITILGRQTVEGFIAMRKALREEGTAAELAAARTRGLHGSIDALQSILETVGTTMASHVGPGLADFVYSLGQGITAMSESEQVARTLEDTLTGVAGVFNVLAESIKAVSVVALPVASVLQQILNAIGVPTILGAVLAYKVLGGTLDRVTKLVTKARTAWAALAVAQTAAASADATAGFARMGGVLTDATAAQTKAIGTTTRLRAAVTAAAGAFNLYALAAAAAAAGLVYLLTRETAAERQARHLKESTDALVESQNALNQARSQARDVPLQVNAAQLGIFEAQAAVAAARSDLANTRAAKGTFARRKAELGLAIALDNVSIAQDRLTDVTERAEEAEIVLANARRIAEEAMRDQIRTVQELADAQRDLLTQLAGQGDNAGRFAQTQALTVKRLTEQYREQADALREVGDIESIQQAERLELIANVSEALKQLPSDQAIEIAIEAPNLKAATDGIIQAFGVTGRRAREALIFAISGQGSQELRTAFEDLITEAGNLLEGLAGREGVGAGDAFARGVASGIRGRRAEAEAATRDLAAGIMNTIKGSLGRSQGLEVAENLAVIASDATAATLPILQQRLSEATRRRRAAEAGLASGQGNVHNLRKARNDAIAEQRQIIEAIRGINESLANEAETAANEAEKKQNEIFENILKAMGLKRDARQQAIEDAQLSEGLADDIAATQKLRRLAKQQIDNLKDRIAAAKKQGLNVEVLADALADLKDVWRDLGREIIDLQREQREALRDILFERFELKIQIAQARGNVAAELRARRARLAELTKELVRMRKQFGKNSIEWLRAKAAQVEEISAIKELEKSTQDKNNALRQLMFEFLTTQQGFAATLLGNLLPIGAIGGVVAGRLAARGGGGGGGGGGTGGGAGAPALAGLQSFGGAAAAAAVAARGARASFATAGAGAIAAPTRGQHATTNQLLNQILQVLRHGNERAKHPSSRKSEKKNSAVQDGIGGV